MKFDEKTKKWKLNASDRWMIKSIMSFDKSKLCEKCEKNADLKQALKDNDYCSRCK